MIEELEGEGDDVVFASISYVLSANVELLYLTGDDDISGTGNDLDNLLVGNDGDNTLTGGAGNDLLDGNAGADLMRGGSGNDMYYVDDMNDVIEDEDGGVVFANASYALSGNLEALFLQGSDDLSGTGNDLNNRIVGNDGNNLLTGGGGDDSLEGLHGDDTLVGGAGNDVYHFYYDIDLVIEQEDEGIDTIMYFASYTLGANLENLSLNGTDNINGTGNALDNELWGNVAANVLDGGTGKDFLHGNHGDDTLLGGDDDDWLYGGDDNDSLVGGDGADILAGEAGTDTLKGGAGNDFYDIDDGSDIAIEEADEGVDEVGTSLNYVLGQNFENLILYGTGNVIGVGNDADNIITGNSGENVLEGKGGNDDLSGSRGADLLIGGNGDDNLYGGTGADTMIGGAGDDNFYTDQAGDVVIETADGGVDWVVVYTDYVLGAYIENLVAYGTGDFALSGNGLDNEIQGNKANNRIDGGAGADTMRGLAGNDTYIIDHAGDRVEEDAGAAGGIDTAIVSLNFSMTSLANVEILKLADGSTANRLTGGTSGDHLIGNTKFDILDGGAGIDTLEGGAGSDVYVVDHAQDVVIETVGNGSDAVQSNVTYSLAAEAAVEFMTALGKNAIDLTGNAFVNTVTGNDAVNRLDGGGGNDSLAGGLGKDVLTGGKGRDLFVFDAKIDRTSKTKKQIDKIMDFSVHDDGIQLDNAIFTKLGKKGTASKPAQISKDFFKAGTKAADANDYLVYNKKTGALSYDADGSGSKAAIQIATLGKNLKLTEKDFFVI